MESVPLKLELKPNERLLLGETMLMNCDQQRIHILIDGPVPIMREKDIMTSSQANSLAKRIYQALQFMYLAKQPQDYELYRQLAGAMVQADPECKPYIERIDNQISSSDLYRALKEARELIAYESASSAKNRTGDRNEAASVPPA